jgi:integrase
MAWLFQDSRQKQKLGDACPWSVGWIDHDGKRRSRKIGSRDKALKEQGRIEAQLERGQTPGGGRKRWSEFVKEYEERVLPALAPRSRDSARAALRLFERHVKLKRVASIRTTTIDEFKAKRAKDAGKKPKSTVSAATINKDLRELKAALRVAHEWGYLPLVPKFRMVREPEKFTRYITPEDFAAIYGACKAARRPRSQDFSPEDWWQALLTFAYMTGWRISEIMALRWDDVSLDQARALTRHGDNKGKRDEFVPLHTVVVEHLRRLADASVGADPGARLVFFWPVNSRSLYSEFAAIQTAAGINLPCHEEHVHTPACHLYGFHDLRRAFATCNAEKLSGDALQGLMRHKSYSTTKRYINMARQLNQAAEKLYVPAVLREEH